MASSSIVMKCLDPPIDSGIGPQTSVWSIYIFVVVAVDEGERSCVTFSSAQGTHAVPTDAQSESASEAGMPFTILVALMRFSSVR